MDRRRGSRRTQRSGRDAPGAGRPKRSHAAAARGRALDRAAFWILVLAIIYGIGALVFGGLGKLGVDAELEKLAVMGEDTPIMTADGRTMTVGEFRDELYFTLLVAFALNAGLAVAFFVCWQFTKTSPVPGTVTAFSIFVLVLAVGAVLDPGTIWHGIIIKIFAIIALVGGMKAAFAQAAAEKQGERPVRRRRAAER